MRYGKDGTLKESTIQKEHKIDPDIAVSIARALFGLARGRGRNSTLEKHFNSFETFMKSYVCNHLKGLDSSVCRLQFKQWNGQIFSYVEPKSLPYLCTRVPSSSSKDFRTPSRSVACDEIQMHDADTQDKRKIVSHLIIWVRGGELN